MPKEVVPYLGSDYHLEDDEAGLRIYAGAQRTPVVNLRPEEAQRLYNEMSKRRTVATHGR